LYSSSAPQALDLQPGAHCGFVSVTQQMLVQFVKGQFPVKRDADENKGVMLSMYPCLETSHVHC
jgi:hypothetical protein